MDMQPVTGSVVTAALKTRGLAKSFGRKIITGLDLTIQPGEFYALLGPNGAGKTTTLRMIAGLLRPDAGRVEIFGVDVVAAPRRAKALMAWLPDEPLLYDRLSPLEYLEFVAGLWLVPPPLAKARAEDLLETLGLWRHRHERCEGFSRGMKQKTVLAGALIHEPKFLLLDEPFTGLDAGSARLVKAPAAGPRRRRCRGDPHHPHPGRGGASRHPHRHPRRRRAAGGGRPRRPARPHRRHRRHLAGGRVPAPDPSVMDPSVGKT